MIYLQETSLLVPTKITKIHIEDKYYLHRRYFVTVFNTLSFVLIPAVILLIARLNVLFETHLEVK